MLTVVLSSADNTKSKYSPLFVKSRKIKSSNALNSDKRNASLRQSNTWVCFLKKGTYSETIQETSLKKLVGYPG